VSHKNVDCLVDTGDDPYGTFANAIQLSLDGSEVLIDFCVYSATENTARVVSRVRVAQEFLPVIHQKIGLDLNVKDAEPIWFLLPTVSGDH
jgi:hypothetical protein